MTRDMLRRLAQLEAKNARRMEAERVADHGLSPEEYARAHAYLTRLLSTHPTNWTLEDDVQEAYRPAELSCTARVSGPPAHRKPTRGPVEAAV
jgi:hypothetical protein